MSGTSQLEALSYLDGKSAATLFEKDLSFFELLLVLINKSCAIKSIDLMWKNGDSIGSDLVQITGTTQALQGTCSRYVHSGNDSPTPRFCEIVQSGCATSDKAAEARVSATGKPEVYRCHAGLVDIAIPVVCDGRHIATLFTGQVLRARPDDPGFQEVLENVRSLGTIDSTQLRAAYDRVPVVTDGDIEDAVKILEVFADYLGTAWKRLLEATEAQQLRLRESQLLRKEMAQILLDGHDEESERLREIARVLGFTLYPNRIMIVQQVGEARPGFSSSSSDLEVTRVKFAVEDLMGKVTNAMAVHLHGREVCVFFSDSGERTGTLSEVKPYALAQKIVNYVHQQCGLRIRLGVGRASGGWNRLKESYQEAWAALTESEATVAFYKEPTGTFQALSDQMSLVCDALAHQDLDCLRSALELVFVFGNSHVGKKTDSVVGLRHSLLLVLGAIMQTARGLACNQVALEYWRRSTCESLELATNALELRDSWASCTDRLVEEVGHANWGKYEQIVEHARALIHKNIDRPEGSQPVSIEEVAALLHVSEGHLSRTFKRIAGVTFERYVIEKRIDRARKLLLDPSSRVSEVADRCDFCNPAYFSRIFRKVVGCTPTEFSKRPTLYQATGAAISQPGPKEESSNGDTAIPSRKTSSTVTESAVSGLLG